MGKKSKYDSSVGNGPRRDVSTNDRLQDQTNWKKIRKGKPYEKSGFLNRCRQTAGGDSLKVATALNEFSATVKGHGSVKN